jgi:hypothetical protein
MPTVENRCEWREETDWQIKVTTALSPARMGTVARILKAILKKLKKLFVRLLPWLFLLWLHFPLAN